MIQTRQNNNSPQCSLPKRQGWNDDPIGKHAKAARAEETKAAKEAKAAKKRRKEAEAKAVKEKLAQMEADESFVQAQEQQHHIQRWLDMNASIHEVDDDLEGDDADENSGGEEPETDSTNEDLRKECAEVSLVYKTCKHRDSLLHLEDKDNEDKGTA